MRANPGAERGKRVSGGHANLGLHIGCLWQFIGFRHGGDRKDALIVNLAGAPLRIGFIEIACCKGGTFVRREGGDPNPLGLDVGCIAVELLFAGVHGTPSRADLAASGDMVLYSQWSRR